MLANIAKLSLALILFIGGIPNCSGIDYSTDPQGYSGGSIFDGAGGVGTGTSSGSSATGGGISICNDNAQTIKKFLLDKGYKEDAANGIMGNLYQESEYNNRSLQFDPDVDDNFVAYNNGKTYKGGFGLAQWTDEGRVKGLQEFANSKGKSVVDIGVQLEYLYKELTDSYYNLGTNVLNPMSLEEATWTVLVKFEDPGNVSQEGTDYQGFVNNPSSRPGQQTEYDRRIKYAKEAQSSITPTGCVNTSDSSAFPNATITTGGVPATIPSLQSFGRQSGNSTTWRGTSCGSGSGPSIEASGCSLVAIANAMKFLGKTPNTPNDVAHDIMSGTPLICGEDETGWSDSGMSINKLADRYSLTLTELWNSSSGLNEDQKLEKIRQALSNGGPVLMRGQRTDPISCDNEDNLTNGKCVFSPNGHFVLVVGVSGDNKLYIANPANNSGAYIPFPYANAVRYATRAAMVK